VADTDESSKQIEKTLQKTPEAAAASGVIGGQQNQEVHAAANDISHANDRSLSEPEMIAIGANETVDQYNARVAEIQANRFQLFDSNKPGNGSAADTGTVIDYPQGKTKGMFALGMDYEERRDTRTPSEKLSAFTQAATKRATDPEGWKTYFQGEIDKAIGIAEGLNIAKEETKSAAALGWKALTDGTVANFLAQPNAINDPLFHAVGSTLDAMSKDPNAINHALERLGNMIQEGSEQYSSLPKREQGQVIGKFMFGMGNPEGSTEGAELALKIAGKVGTKLDQAFLKTVQESLQSIELSAYTSPQLAQQTKQIFFEYLRTKGLSVQELELAGVPKGYFDDIQKAHDALNMPEVPDHLKHLELQPASEELLAGMKAKGREIVFAAPGSEEMEYLKFIGAEANTGGSELNHILLKPNPSKIAALEEFLHGTQGKLGFFTAKDMPGVIGEVRVKDFMLRHRKMLGLTDNEVQVLEVLKENEIDKAMRFGYTPFEIGEKRW